MPRKASQNPYCPRRYANVLAGMFEHAAELSPEQRKLSDRYFEGGYWVQVWQLLFTVGICVLLLITGASRRMSLLSQRLSRHVWISTPIYIALFLLAGFLLGLPLSIYTDFIREHQYGLSEQSFGGWMRDQLIMLGPNTVLAAPKLCLLDDRAAVPGWFG